MSMSMPDATDASREQQRQAAVDRLSRAFAETALDDITRTAADMFQVPVALVTVIDGDQQRFASRFGTEVTATPRDWAFCAHAIEQPDQVMMVEDLTLDPRFALNPLVTREPHVRFYAGAPLVTSSGHAVGTVCVLDVKPRQIEREQLESLRFLAQQVMTTLEARHAARN